VEGSFAEIIGLPFASNFCNLLLLYSYKAL
jgi:hypothetical protein